MKLFILLFSFFCSLSAAARPNLDLLVSRIIAAVMQKGAWECTIFIFTSDNGGVMTPDTLTAGDRANGTLQGRKSDIWEGGHRVPFIVRWPGRVAAGSECGHFVCLTDVLATLIDIIGQSFDAVKSPDSLSLVPLLDGKAPDAARNDRAMILMSGGSFPGVGVRQGRWMFICGHGPGGITRSGKLKPGGTGYASYAEACFTNDSLDSTGKPVPDAPADQLYDLAAAPAQKHNVLTGHPEIAKRLAAHLEMSLSKK